MQRNTTTSSWLNETPLPSPKHVATATNYEQPQTVHHYYTPPQEQQQQPPKKSNNLLFCFYIIVGIVLMYGIHCLYTMPESRVWSDYLHIQTFT